MEIQYNNKGSVIFNFNLFFLCFTVVAAILLCLMLYPEKATSGPYLDSVHGSSSYGVNRTSLSAFGYSKGNCAHCHEQHALIGGSEPNPTGGPDKYVLFFINHINQTDNFFFKFHIYLNFF